MAELTLDAWLAKLEADKARIELMIQGVRAELGLEPSVLSSSGGGLGMSTDRAASGPGKIRTDEFFQMSIPEAIKKYLGIMKQPQAPITIVEALKAGGLLTNAKHFYANVWTALKRLESAAEVTNVGKGWGLAEWYKGRAMAAPGKEGTGKKKPKGRPRGRPKKRVAESSVPAAEPRSSGNRSVYRAFLKTALATGKSMKEANADWKSSRTKG